MLKHHNGGSTKAVFDRQKVSLETFNWFSLGVPIFEALFKEIQNF